MNQLKGETMVDGVLIQPWTHVQIVRLLPCFEKIIQVLEDKSFDFGEIERGHVDFNTMLRLIFTVWPYTLEVVAESTGINSEEIGQWDFDKVARIVLTIFLQNIERIKSFHDFEMMIIKSLN